MAEVGKAEAILTLDKSKFDAGLSQAEGQFSGLGNKAAGVGSTIAGAMVTAGVATGVAVAGIATAGLSAFMNVEAAASSAASKAVDVNGKSADQIKAQYDSIQSHVIEISNQLAATTIFDPTQVANAFDILAAKGSNIANIGQTELLPFLDLAAGTQTDLATATDLVTGAINSFGLQMSDSGMVADQMAMAMNGSSAASDTLNYALRQGGATAAASGMQLSEFSAIVGILADKNYTGEQSGAALKTALLALYTPTQKQTDALAKLGLTYDQVDPRTHKFRDTLELLLSKGADIGDFGSIFTDSSGAIMYALAGAGDACDDLAAKIDGSTGLAHAQASLIMDTEKLVGAWETAKGATEGMTAAIGGALEPAAVKLLNTWTAIAPAVQEFAVALASGDWSKAEQMIEDAFRGAWEAIQEIDWGAIATKAVSVIQAGWQGLSNLGSQLLSWLQGVDWSGVAETIVSAVRMGWDALQDIGQTLYDWIVSVDWAGLATSIATTIRDNWATITDWAGPIIDKFVDDFTEWVDSGGPRTLGENVATAIAKGAADLGRWIYDKVKNWWESNGSSLGGAIASVINFAGVAIRAAYDFVVGFASKILELGKGTIGASILETIGNAMNEAWDGAGDSLISKAGEWRATIADVLADVPDEIETDIKTTFTGDGNPMLLDGSTVKINVAFQIGDEEFKIKNMGGEGYALQQKTGEGNSKGDWSYVGEWSKSIDTLLEQAEKIAGVTLDASEKQAAAASSNAQSAQANAQSSSEVAQATANMAAGAQANAQSTAEMGSAAASQALAASSLGQQAQASVDAALNFAASMDQGAALSAETAATSAAEFAELTSTASTDAATTTTTASTDAATTTKTAATDSATTAKTAAKDSATAWKTGVDGTAKAIQQAAQTLSKDVAMAGQKLVTSATNASNMISAAGTTLSKGVTASATAIQTGGTNCGNSVAAGGRAAADALSGAASAIRSAVSALSSLSIPAHARGTRTKGPEIALIGEAGSEYVLPADGSRPDLMVQAMGDYGIPDTALASLSGNYSNVSGITVTSAKNTGAGQGSALTAALEKAAAMLAEATRYLAQTAEALGGAVEDMANAAGSWASTVRETTAEINAINAEAAQTNADLATETAQIISDMERETGERNKEVAAEIAEKVKTAMNGGASALMDAGRGAAGSISHAGQEFGKSAISAGRGFAGIASDAGAEFAKKITEVGQKLTSDIQRAANLLMSAGTNAGANIQRGGQMCGSAVAQGGAYAASALIQAANMIMSAAAGMGGSGGHALGTVTTGPELAWIGEAGREYVIPTATKRWDLLYAAMADYGLRVPEMASGGVINTAAISRVGGGRAEGRIVIEDHTVHELYIDGQKVTDVIMTRSMQKIKRRQAALSNW